MSGHPADFPPCRDQIGTAVIEFLDPTRDRSLVSRGAILDDRSNGELALIRQTASIASSRSFRTRAVRDYSRLFRRFGALKLGQDQARHIPLATCNHLASHSDAFGKPSSSEFGEQLRYKLNFVFSHLFQKPHSILVDATHM